MRLEQDEIESYVAALRDRLQQGDKEYGSSKGRQPVELANEIMQELEDVSGWACLLWVRLRRIRDQLQ